MKKINQIISTPDKRANLERRFWPKVKRAAKDDCWEWIAKAKHPFGYGRMTAGRGVHLKAHQIAYALEKGPIPDDGNVLHECDNPSCCNPKHLSIGTHKRNMDEMTARGRRSPPPHRFGEEHHNAKFTEIEARQIIKDTRPAKAIAAEYGTTEKTVYCLKQGSTWKKLPHT